VDAEAIFHTSFVSMEPSLFTKCGIQLTVAHLFPASGTFCWLDLILILVCGKLCHSAIPGTELGELMGMDGPQMMPRTLQVSFAMDPIFTLANISIPQLSST
jgi:hypothetical protein